MQIPFAWIYISSRFLLPAQSMRLMCFYYFVWSGLTLVMYCGNGTVDWFDERVLVFFQLSLILYSNQCGNNLWRGPDLTKSLALRRPFLGRCKRCQIWSPLSFVFSQFVNFLTELSVLLPWILWQYQSLAWWGMLLGYLNWSVVLLTGCGNEFLKRLISRQGLISRCFQFLDNVHLYYLSKVYSWEQPENPMDSNAEAQTWEKICHILPIVLDSARSVYCRHIDHFYKRRLDHEVIDSGLLCCEGTLAAISFVVSFSNLGLAH